MMKKQHLWPGKAVSFITAARVIINNARQHQSRLAGTDTTVDARYLSDLEARLAATEQSYLGLDRNAALREATQTLRELQDISLNLLGDVKLAIETKIKDATRRTELLKLLGYSQYYKEASHRQQESLTQLLLRFREHADPSLHAELANAGVPGNKLNDLRDLAQNFHAANVSQETAKGERLQLTDAAVDSLNELYLEVVALCKLGARVFRDQPGIRPLFILDTVMSNLTGGADTRTDAAPTI